MGSISLLKDEREWQLDFTHSYFSEEHSYTIIEVELDDNMMNREVFTDCKFDLTDEDLEDLDVAEIYIGWEEGCEQDYQADIESITLKGIRDHKEVVVELDSDPKSIKNNRFFEYES